MARWLRQRPRSVVFADENRGRACLFRRTFRNDLCVLFDGFVNACPFQRGAPFGRARNSLVCVSAFKNGGAANVPVGNVFYNPLLAETVPFDSKRHPRRCGWNMFALADGFADGCRQWTRILNPEMIVNKTVVGRAFRNARFPGHESANTSEIVGMRRAWHVVTDVAVCEVFEAGTVQNHALGALMSANVAGPSGVQKS